MYSTQQGVQEQPTGTKNGSFPRGLKSLYTSKGDMNK